MNRGSLGDPRVQIVMREASMRPRFMNRGSPDGVDRAGAGQELQ